jgi:hypothetical protein
MLYNSKLSQICPFPVPSSPEESRVQEVLAEDGGLEGLERPGVNFMNRFGRNLRTIRN